MKDQNKIRKAPETKLTDEQLRDVNAGQVATSQFNTYMNTQSAVTQANDTATRLAYDAVLQGTSKIKVTK